MKVLVILPHRILDPKCARHCLGQSCMEPLHEILQTRAVPNGNKMNSFEAHYKLTDSHFVFLHFLHPILSTFHLVMQLLKMRTVNFEWLEQLSGGRDQLMGNSFVSQNMTYTIFSYRNSMDWHWLPCHVPKKHLQKGNIHTNECRTFPKSVFNLKYKQLCFACFPTGL